jgi:hypothetical protein
LSTRTSGSIMLDLSSAEGGRRGCVTASPPSTFVLSTSVEVTFSPEGAVAVTATK